MYPFLTNAAGEGSKSIEEIKGLVSSNPYRAAVVGSITLEKRKILEPEGKSNFVYFENLRSSINSIGLKNPGLDYYKKNLPKILKEFPKSKLILSIAYAPVKRNYKNLNTNELNSNPELQFEILTRELSRINKEKIIIETNLSCPNINEDLILYEDLKLTENILERVEKEAGEKRYTVKLGYMLPGHLNRMASLISCYNPFGVVAINTMLGMIVDEKESSYFAQEYGGIGGEQIRPFALLTVSKLRKKLNKEGRKDIKLIGCGGISNVKDCLKFLKAGAEYLQIGTEFMAKGNKKLFSNLLFELFEKKSHHLV